MDVTVPPHNLKRLAASVACLSKVGKDLYVSFDPLDGLTLSSLNEAKSAYGRHRFEPGFFERCSSPPMVMAGGAFGGGGGRRWTCGRGGGGGGAVGVGGDESDDDDASYDYDARYVCRVPVQSVRAVLRPRKGVTSLRIRSEGADGEGRPFGLSRRRRRKEGGGRRRGGRSRGRRRPGGGDEDDDDENNDDGNDDEEAEDRRGSFSARERSRSRKRRRRRRREADDDENGDGDDDDDTSPRNPDKMTLAFEFTIHLPTPKDQDPETFDGGTFRVVHKVGVTDARGISLSASAGRRRTRSEIAGHPRLWLRLLDPLRRTAEVALTVDDELRVVTATSFHPQEAGTDGAGGGTAGGGDRPRGGDNALTRAERERNAVLKTETSTGAEEFDEYDFRSNRGRRKKGRRKGGGDDDDGESDGGDDPEEDEDGERGPPPDVNQRAILVFGIKEAKAMLQYCAQAAQCREDECAVLSFHWGGRPVVLEAEGECSSAELVLATLHHGMIASNVTVGGEGGR
ncbi:hypothetical protein ACHAWF_001880 [Thalassiosira exigua]